MLKGQLYPGNYGLGFEQLVVRDSEGIEPDRVLITEHMAATGFARAIILNCSDHAADVIASALKQAPFERMDWRLKSRENFNHAASNPPSKKNKKNGYFSLQTVFQNFNGLKDDVVSALDRLSGILNPEQPFNLTILNEGPAGPHKLDNTINGENSHANSYHIDFGKDELSRVRVVRYFTDWGTRVGFGPHTEIANKTVMAIGNSGYGIGPGFCIFAGNVPHLPQYVKEDKRRLSYRITFNRPEFG